MITLHIIALLTGLALVAIAASGRLTLITSDMDGERQANLVAPLLAATAGLCVVATSLSAMA